MPTLASSLSKLGVLDGTRFGVQETQALDTSKTVPSRVKLGLADGRFQI